MKVTRYRFVLFAVVAAMGVTAVAALPKGAVRIEGIRSSGCYVDTKYVPNSKTRVVMRFQLNALPQNTGSFSGLQETNNRQFMFGVSAALQFRFAVTPAGSWSANDIGPADCALHEFDIASGLQKFDGEECGTSVIDDGASETLYIFGMNSRWSGGADYLQAITVYSCKIYEDGKLVRDFIPCVHENRVRLWDGANGEWYDKGGTGTFEPTADITGTVDEIPNVVTDGSQYLNTGVVPTPKTRFELDFQMMSTRRSQMVGFQGCPNEKGQFYFAVNKNGDFTSSVVGDLGTGEVVTIAQADTKRHTLVIRSGSQTLDGKEYAQQVIPEGVFTDEIYLFAGNDRWIGNANRFCLMWFFGCKIYEDNELIRDYRPVMTSHGPAVVDFVSMQQGEPTTTICFCASPSGGWQRTGTVVASGMSYIDTGVKLTPQTSVRIDFKMDKADPRQSVVGYQGGANGRAQLLFSIQDRTGKGEGFCFVSTLVKQDGRDYNVAGPADTNRHVLEIRPGSQKFDGREYATEALAADVPVVDDGNLYLFAFNNRYMDDASNLATMRLYRCQIWEGDALVRDFRPAVLFNGVGCLVDAVTGFAIYFAEGEHIVACEPLKKGLVIMLQ